MGQVIGTVNVQVGQSTNPRAVAVNYGVNQLKLLTDVNVTNLIDGNVLVYSAAKNNFFFTPINTAFPDIDNGFF
jgi:hypothetical protein